VNRAGAGPRAPALAAAAAWLRLPAVVLLFAFAPLFLAFELWQLVVAERYVGIKQIGRGTDPRELGLGQATAAGWSLTLFAYWVWMGLMLLQPWGQLQVLLMIVVSIAGFMLRRGCGLKWLLVILTFEGSIRIGMLLSLGALAWRRLL